jgi:hypothetical protein
MRWRVERQDLLAEPPRGWDVERAIAVRLVRGRGEKHTIIVGYDVGAPTVSARMAVEPYLDDDDPPKRLLVQRDGQITRFE